MNLNLTRYVGLALVVCLAAGNTAYAQKFTSKKKGPLIGFSGNLTDFQTPATIQQSSLGDVLKDGTWAKIKDIDPGLSLMYWQGLTNRLDVSGRYNLLISDYSKSETRSQLAHELEGSLHLRALTDDHLLTPFVTAGVGIGTYGKQWAPYSPLGIGLQVNLRSLSYIFLQGNYRVSYTKSAADNSLFYSLGVTQNIRRTKKEDLKPVPIPAVEKKDADNDGVEDDVDECPDVAGPASLNGCPDRDGDGVADKDDKCPDVKGLARYNGCPIPDTDGDGLNDEDDKCPTEAGPASNGGCPEAVAPLPTLSEGNPQFSTGSARLSSRSLKPLDEAVSVLQQDADLKLVIEGHADITGPEAFNQPLSERRAKAVANYLIRKGINAGRLTTIGYGSTRPIASNETAEGRKQNRRVELKLEK